MSEQTVRDYLTHYCDVDVWTQRGQGLNGEHWVGVSEQLVRPEELRKTEFYNDFLVKNQASHAMFSLVERSPETLASLGIYRGTETGEYEREDTELLHYLTPHIRRAYRLYFQLHELLAHEAIWKENLDRLATGVLLLGPKGRVLQMNRTAERLVSAGDGLAYREGRLMATEAREAAELRRLIGEADLRAGGGVVTRSGAMRVTRGKGSALSLTVCPLGGGNREVESPRSVVFLQDPDDRDSSRP